MSEHREHLLPDAEDVPCRGTAIVEPNADMGNALKRRRPLTAQMQLRGFFRWVRQCSGGRGVAAGHQDQRGQPITRGAPGD
jgi:hypothetical protein